MALLEPARPHTSCSVDTAAPGPEPVLSRFNRSVPSGQQSMSLAIGFDATPAVAGLLSGAPRV
ncbi:hypothetical protein BN970_03779 [Mycolicibacterium conceptionense]|uniref:Uncharacterized protein n=1 Tax=Mycolicibacterium conceptionense TaxID=451644 RepID=A0A0U1DM52_9MYCO|nr:hypothetical protein BN970_03779 [Mycolicibacterium conceptionense]